MERARMAESGRWELEVSGGQPWGSCDDDNGWVSESRQCCTWLHWGGGAQWLRWATLQGTRYQVPGTYPQRHPTWSWPRPGNVSSIPAFQHSSLRLQPISIYPNASSRHLYNYSSNESISTVPFVSSAALMAWHTRNAASPA